MSAQNNTDSTKSKSLQKILESFTASESKAASSSASMIPIPDALGENGMPAHSSTCGNPGPNSNEGFLLDFFVMAVRSQKQERVKNSQKGGRMVTKKVTEKPDQNALLSRFQKAWCADPHFTLAMLAQLRDCRNGKGEIDLSMTCMQWLRENFPRTYLMNLETFIDMGCYKDLCRLVSNLTKSKSPSLSGSDTFVELMLMADCLLRDIETFDNSTEDETPPKLSLVAKWAPSVGKKGFNRPANGQQATALARLLFPHDKVSESEKMYRKKLSALRTQLDVVEKHMSSKNFDHINLPSIPSKAHFLYRKALKKQLGATYDAYLDALKKGETKINCTGMDPHTLLAPYYAGGDRDEVVEAQWKTMLDKLRASGLLTNSFALVDVSGSMNGIPMQVAIALGLIVSELGTGDLHNKVCTFHENPQIHTLLGDSLHERYKSMKNMEWGMNTNLWKVFHHLFKMESRVDNLFIFTDMQFDSANNNGPVWKDSFQTLKTMFEGVGKPMPNIVFWNLRADTVAFPTTKDTPGAALVSGFSPQLLKVFMTGGEFTPMSVLRRSIEPYLPKVHPHPEDIAP